MLSILKYNAKFVHDYVFIEQINHYKSCNNNNNNEKENVVKIVKDRIVTLVSKIALKHLKLVISVVYKT